MTGTFGTNPIKFQMVYFLALNYGCTQVRLSLLRQRLREA